MLSNCVGSAARARPFTANVAATTIHAAFCIETTVPMRNQRGKGSSLLQIRPALTFNRMPTEIEVKTQRLSEFLDHHSLDGVLLTLRSNFSWITGGRVNR